VAVEQRDHRIDLRVTVDIGIDHIAVLFLQIDKFLHQLLLTDKTFDTDIAEVEPFVDTVGDSIVHPVGQSHLADPDSGFVIDPLYRRSLNGMLAAPFVKEEVGEQHTAALRVLLGSGFLKRGKSRKDADVLFGIIRFLKRILMRIFMIITLFVVSLFAGEIEWMESFAEAKAKAQKEDKIIYALITSETCRWCRKLESTTLEEERVIEKVNSKYSAVALTRGKDEYPPCLKAPMVPMSYFLTPEGRVLYSVPGYWSKEDYLSMMDDVERKYQKQKSAQKDD